MKFFFTERAVASAPPGDATPIAGDHTGDHARFLRTSRGISAHKYGNLAEFRSFIRPTVEQPPRSTAGQVVVIASGRDG
jgi:hypothetical protein